MTGVLIKRNLDTEPCTQGEHHEHKGRDWDDVTTSQGMSITDRKLPALGERQGLFFLSLRGE